MVVHIAGKKRVAGSIIKEKLQIDPDGDDSTLKFWYH
jgi:hypothetical protein